MHLLKAAQQLQLPENEQFLLSMLLEELELMAQQQQTVKNEKAPAAEEKPQEIEKPESSKQSETESANSGEEHLPAAEIDNGSTALNETQAKSEKDGSEQANQPAEEV